jgi:transposase InsO family protein
VGDEACPDLPKERCDTTNAGTVVPLCQPEETEHPLAAILRNGARRLLAWAVEAEAFLAEMRGLRLPDGRERLGPHGHGPERLVQTGIGPVAVRRVKLRDLGKGCREAGVRPSMGSVGDAYDNAPCESFFATLECELPARSRFASHAEARMATFSFIEARDNPARLHSSLGYRSPVAYGEEQLQAAAVEP